MADRLTTIEQNLADVILLIDGTLQSTGYTYYTDVDIVNIEDEGLVSADEYITSGGTLNSFPMVNVYLDPSEDVEEMTANVYVNKAYFKLVGKVSNENNGADAPQNSKFEINKHMSELLSDIKFVIGMNFTLNDTVDRCTLISSSREYTEDNDVFRTGNIIIKLEVDYTQSWKNPDNNICY